MASGQIVGEKDGGEEDSKVYARENNISKSLKTSATPTDDNSSQPENIPVESDDLSSHNRLQPSAQNSGEQPDENAVPGYVKFDNFVKISFNLKDRNEVKALKRKLAGELDQVVSLMKKLEDKQKSTTVNTSAVRMNSEVGSVEPANPRAFQGSDVSLNENVSNYKVIADSTGKVKNVPKRNHSYQNLDLVRRKENLSPMESSEKLKSDKIGREFVLDKDLSRCFRSCGNLLDKLMKHKYGWVFNNPVDVKGLGLHDYYTIIKNPMDLGTVKGRLSKKLYESPNEFVKDVRLTFSNAMLYNPKGQDAHIMAEQLSNIFEDKWRQIEAEFNFSRRLKMGRDSGFPTPPSRTNPIPHAPVHSPASVPPPRSLETRTLERVEPMTMPVDSKTKASSLGHQFRTPAPKKPKAEDPGKRDMTYEEKQILSSTLQDFPSDEMENIVQIINKRNPVLSQEDDEIEVDIESVDTETLWELDRFVTNYKKSLSKNKGKAEFALQAKTQADNNIQDTDMEPVITKTPNETDAGEKIVAISSPKRGDDVSESSSSSSSSSDSRSSSSDSDSDGSSA